MIFRIKVSFLNPGFNSPEFTRLQNPAQDHSERGRPIAQRDLLLPKQEVDAQDPHYPSDRGRTSCYQILQKSASE